MKYHILSVINPILHIKHRLKYENLKENIQKVISEIPKEKYVPKNKTRKIKKIINDFYMF